MTKLNTVKSGRINVGGTVYSVVTNRPNKLKYRGTTVILRGEKGRLKTISCTAAKKCKRVRSVTMAS